MMMKVEEIEQRWVTDNREEKILLLRYYPEHKIYAYIGNGAGYGFIKESAINGIQDLGKDTR